MDDLPLVSVIMGVRYTRPDTALLERAVRSILDQTYTDLELLICDDGSTPDAKAWLERVSAQDARMRLVRNAACLDLGKKLNLCLTAATGEYIARMDDDDYSHPDRLEKQLRFLRSDPENDFVGCIVDLFRNGEAVGTRQLPRCPRVEDFFFVQPYIHPALVFRNAALRAVGGYSESPDCLLCEDYDLLLRLYQHGYRGANLQEVLLDYTLPTDPKGNRRMRHRLNEAKTRYRRFRDLGRLPKALPYVVKPIAVGLIPSSVLDRVKRKCTEGTLQDGGDIEKPGK